ncbi:MAG: hypothetical protein U1F34_02050 [Gammaproteobacteria bacterium]
MPLYIAIDPICDDYAVINDLLVCAYGDNALTLNQLPDCWEVYYEAQQKFGAGPNRLYELVHSWFGFRIVAAGVGSGFVFADGTPISSIAGGCVPYQDMIFAIYDVQDNYGRGYCVPGLNTPGVWFQSFIIAFHELSHAFHIANGTQPEDILDQEYLAICEENELRFDLALPLRDPNNYLGIGTCRDQTPSGETESDSTAGETEASTTADGEMEGPLGISLWGNECFILTALDDERIRPIIHNATILRDKVLRTLRSGSRLCDSFFCEYDQYSPRIARDMKADPVLREMIGWTFVLPVVYAYLMIWDKLGLDSDIFPLQGIAVSTSRSKAYALVEAHACRLVEMDINQEVVKSCERAIRELVNEHGDDDSETREPTFVDTRDVRDLIVYLRRSLKNAATDLTLTRWALLQPLAMFWALTVDVVAGHGKERNCDEMLSAWCVTWLTNAPMSATTDLQKVIAELAQFNHNSRGL